MIGARTPVPDFHEPPPEVPTPLTAAPPSASAQPRRRTLVLAGAVVLVALALLFTTYFLVSADGATSSPTEVTGFAEDFVFVFLARAGEGSESYLGPFLGYTPSLAGMLPGRFYVTQVTARDLHESSDGWVVLIRAEALARTGQGYAPADPKHFAVRVVEDPDGYLRALALPAPAPAPLISAAPAPPVSPADGATVSAASDYLSWYLTGSAPINGVTPAGGFESIELVGLDIGEETATASVLATTSEGHALRVEVPLIEADGMWEFLDLSPPPS